MSADLFAEFANNLPPQSLPNQKPISTSSRGTKQPTAENPFSFGSIAKLSATTTSHAEQWPSLHTRQSGMSSWLAGPILSEATPVPATSIDDDGWGDFEIAAPAAPPANKALPSQLGGSSASSERLEPKPRIRAPTIDLMTNALVDVGHKAETKIEPAGSFAQDASPKKPIRHIQSLGPNDLNVLFDVDGFKLQEGEGGDDDDDEFGDFETVAPAASQLKVDLMPASKQLALDSNRAPLLDLLSLNDPLQQPTQAKTRKRPPPQLLGALSFAAAPLKTPNAPKSPSIQERKPFADLEIKTTVAAGAAKKEQDNPASATPATVWPMASNQANSSNDWKDEDDWEAWDDIPSHGGNHDRDIDRTDPPDDWGWDASGSPGPPATGSADNDPPPINVPPPSVILSMFPELLSSGDSLFKSIIGQNASVKQQILSSPKAVQFLQGYILLATTAARVIAGRKHRWHRDKILAKSMSISAAGSKGMKLAGVDKTQATREDREAANVAAVWREHVGRLRSAVAAAKAVGMAKVKVPELSENLHIQTAKMVPTAHKACIICGLRREERVSKVDYDVEDSFGEWWVDHWGHRACKNFWVEHEQKLRQR